MTERCMADIVAEGDGLRQILVETQASRDGPRYLRHFETMCHARAIMIASHDVDLGLPLETPKRFRMQDAVTVALEFCPEVTFLHRQLAPGIPALGRLWCQQLIFQFFSPFSDIQSTPPPAAIES